MLTTEDVTIFFLFSVIRYANDEVFMLLSSPELDVTNGRTQVQNAPLPLMGCFWTKDEIA